MSWVGVITDAGKDLFANYAQSGLELSINKCTCGNSKSAQENMRSQTELVGTITMDGVVESKVNVQNGVQFRLKFGAAPADPGAFTMKEIGLFVDATDGETTTTTMVAYYIETGDGINIPLKSNFPDFAYVIVANLAIDNTIEMAIEVDPDAVISVSAMEAYINEHNARLRYVPFSIAVSDWTLADDIYSATYDTELITETSNEEEFYDSTLRTSVTGDIWGEKKSGGGGYVFHTDSLPTGYVSGELKIIDAPDGKLPFVYEETVWSVERGGTGETNVNGIKQLLSLDDASSKKVANDVTTTQEGFVLDARQGRILQEEINSTNDHLGTLDSEIDNKSINKVLTFGVEQSSDFSGTIDKILLYLRANSGLVSGESRPFICQAGTWDTVKGSCFKDSNSKVSFFGFNSSNILLNGTITTTGGISRGIWTGATSG